MGLTPPLSGTVASPIVLCFRPKAFEQDVRSALWRMMRQPERIATRFYPQFVTARSPAASNVSGAMAGSRNPVQSCSATLCGADIGGNKTNWRLPIAFNNEVVRNPSSCTRQMAK